MPPLKPLEGKRFGRLVVQSRKNRGWECLCDCGAQSLVNTSDLTGGNTQSCGCLAKEKLSNRRKNVWSDEILSFIKISIRENKGYKEIAQSIGWKAHQVKYCAAQNGFKYPKNLRAHKEWEISIEEVISLKAEGKKMKDIAKISGVSRSRIYQVLKSAII